MDARLDSAHTGRVKRIGEVFAFKGMDKGSASGVKLKGDIKMRNVTFAYEKKPVLKT